MKLFRYTKNKYTVDLLHKSRKGEALAPKNLDFSDNLLAPMLRPYSQILTFARGLVKNQLNVDSRSRTFFWFLSFAFCLLSLTSCSGGKQPLISPSGAIGSGNSDEKNPSPTPSNSGLSGEVNIDGSTTLLLLSEAMMEGFQKANSGVKVTIKSSDTAKGFQEFCNGAIEISNASRPMKAEEDQLCKQSKIEYIELPISADGIVVVVNPQNNAVAPNPKDKTVAVNPQDKSVVATPQDKPLDCLKVDELKKIWAPSSEGSIKTWNQINPKFTKNPLTLFGPDKDSGTYNFFTKAIIGQEGKSRTDYTASEDDNILVLNVAADKTALGFFGYPYYETNKDKLKAVAIDSGKGCVIPSPDTIKDGTYQPLTRVDFIYVRKEAASRPEVKAFVEFMLNTANKKLFSEIGYIPLPEELMKEVQQRFADGQVGSRFDGKGDKVGVTLKDLITEEKKTEESEKVSNPAPEKSPIPEKSP